MLETFRIWLEQPGWYAYFSVLVFLLGACVGSFLNVGIYRIPLEKSVIWPPSHCPHCEQRIPWYRNIPIVTWMIQRGRSACCGKPISPRYAVVEFLVAVLFLLVWIQYGADLRTPVYWLAMSGLVLGTFVDFEHMIIPDRVTWGGIAAGLLISPLVPSLHGAEDAASGFLRSLTGAAFGFGLLWAIGALGKVIFKKEAMGFGDVKLLGAIGAFLGWQSVLFVLIVSSFLGSLVGIGSIVLGSKEWQSRIPYGPYIAGAAAVWILWGHAWWAAYIDWVLRVPQPPM